MEDDPEEASTAVALLLSVKVLNKCQMYVTSPALLEKVTFSRLQNSRQIVFSATGP